MCDNLHQIDLTNHKQTIDPDKSFCWGKIMDWFQLQNMMRLYFYMHYFQVQ